MSESEKESEMIVVYDGECPFCANYVKMVRLREAAGNVRLVNARTDDPAVDRIRAEGLDLNEGMALIEGDRIWYGDACIHRLALLSTSSDLFNRMNARIFRSERLSKILYPVLRFGRNATLTMLGRKPIPDKN